MNPGRYFVRVLRGEAGGFEWRIYREGDVEQHRSTHLFETRIAALLDSARAVGELNSDAVVEALSERPINHALSGA